MTLKEAQEQFEAKFKTVVREFGEVPWLAPNGKHYVVVGPDGIKREGEPFPKVYDSEDIASERWFDAAVTVAGSKLNTLYWRSEPVWDVINGAGIVYSRFVTE